MLKREFWRLVLPAGCQDRSHWKTVHWILLLGKVYQAVRSKCDLTYEREVLEDGEEGRVGCWGWRIVIVDGRQVWPDGR